MQRFAANGQHAQMEAPAARSRPAQNRPTSSEANRDLGRFVRSQVIDVQRNAAELRPFKPTEFGSGPASPSVAHVQAANAFLMGLQKALLTLVSGMGPAAGESTRRPTHANLHRFLTSKELGARGVKELERVWDYFFELFGQRQTRFADWLLAADRIGLNCYQAVYTGLGKARSVPTPPPFAYMETGFTPSTYRRGVVLTKLGKRKNPFPIVKLPYHRLVNPWSLGAIHHEVSHNLQNDLDLWQEVPRRLLTGLRRDGIPPVAAAAWSRWHKEIWADLCGLLLGGPANVTSLMGVVSKSPRATLAYSAEAVHPVPYLRVLINLELLRRMGFPREAESFRQVWERMYPSAGKSNIPREILTTFPKTSRRVVEIMCLEPYPQLGDKSLMEVVHFRPAHQQMVAEAAQRLAAGTDPGIIPSRFLVGATRWALSRNLAPPDRIARNFYQAVVK